MQASNRCFMRKKDPTDVNRSIQKRVYSAYTLVMFRVLALLACCLALSAPVPAAAQDSTANCGRFFLKTNPVTGLQECVGGRRNIGNSGQRLEQLTQQLQQSARQLQQLLDGAETILRTRQLTQEAEQRVRVLLTEAERRSRDVRRFSREVAQAARTRAQELQTTQRQATQRQIQLARELEQRQRALTDQLIAEQRARTQQLLRAPTVN